MNRKAARDVVNECGARMRFNVLTNHFVFHDASNNPYPISGYRLQDMGKDELRRILTQRTTPEAIAAAKANNTNED